MLHDFNPGTKGQWTSLIVLNHIILSASWQPRLASEPPLLWLSRPLQVCVIIVLDLQSQTSCFRGRPTSSLSQNYLFKVFRFPLFGIKRLSPVTRKSNFLSLNAYTSQNCDLSEEPSDVSSCLWRTVKSWVLAHAAYGVGCSMRRGK